MLVCLTPRSSQVTAGPIHLDRATTYEVEVCVEGSDSGVHESLGMIVVSAHCWDQQLCHDEGEVGRIGNEGHVPGATGMSCGLNVSC